MTQKDRGAMAQRRWPIAVVFVAIVALQLALAVVSIDVLTAVRAYVNGESLYSKGQKDAHVHLLDYLEQRRDGDYYAFVSALSVPLGDRVAREALLQPRPDIEQARLGFLAGANQADDADSMVRLFVWFGDLPLMAGAIATWTEADQLIERMQELAHEARRRIANGADAASLDPLRRQVRELNGRLSALQKQFSGQLGDSSRSVSALLLGLNVGLAALLALTAFVFVRRSARAQASTEDALRQREESLQRLLDSVAEGLYGVDVNGRCTFINRAALQMLGHASEAELLGSDVNGLIRPRSDEATEPGATKAEVCAAFRENRRIHIADAAIRRSDGSLLPVECWSHPVVQDGVTQGAVVTFVDVSQRVKMQAALRAGELRVMQLVDVVSEGVITIDADERIVFFNRAAEAIFGVRSIDARRNRVDRFITRVGGERVSFDAVSGGVIELTGIHADARVFPIEASVSRLDTENGPLLTIVLRDATEQHAIREERRAREALEASSRAKTDFLSRMSHELRTPLNAVLGFSNLLRLDRQHPPTLVQLERIQHIENAGAHLLALVNDMLDLSRVESGQMVVALEPVNLALAVRESFAMVASLAAEHSVQLRVDLGDGDLVEPEAIGQCGCEVRWVGADPVRLRQVIVNLLSNAVKYNQSGGRVTLSGRVDDDACIVRIADTGAGMDAQQLQRLFEPFNRLGAEKSGIEGTGIGLVLSRRLTELMGGELRIDSEVGYGTTATLTLRLARAPGPPVQAPASPSDPDAPAAQIDVLYAEDDPVNAELVRQILQLRPAVNLRVAETGAAALRMAQVRVPDLLLVDMNLPDMSGVQLARRLRMVASLRDVRLVALSADALPQQIASALATGFDRYLTKPIDFQQLLRVIDDSTRAVSYA
jgi:PAS domain S-box-containing protein